MTRLLILALLLLQEQDVELDSDRAPKTKTGGTCVIKNATIHTVAAQGTITGDLLIENGKIKAIGNVKAPEKATVIDATGLHVMPGIIDCHSHIANEGGLNEGTQSVTPEVRIADILQPDDVDVYRALAGGCTTANILHGSANTIGGQNAVIKLRWGKRDLLFEGAPRGIKFALGENVKQSNFFQNRGKRFPNTRMGVEATLRRAFTEAQEYMKNPPARRDLRLETLADILRGKILVHCHCYRADEILMILRIAKEFGFKLATLQHVLEGYKVAPEIAEAGVGASTFADWWAFKIEAYDATPYNAALMTEAGVVVSINSDSSDQIRRLNLEAAKAMKYGRMSELDAMKLVTLNPAKQLGIDKRVGTIEVGKDADLAFFRGHPLSTSSRCVRTMIDGEVYFEKLDGEGESVEFKPTFADPIGHVGGDTIAFKNADIYGHGPGTLVVSRGKIVSIGGEIPRNAEVVDCKGHRIYPGLVDCETSLGLTEIGSVAGTRDESEIGNVQPDLLALTAVNAHTEHFPVARANGITTALVVPNGGLVPGQSSYIRLAGWTTKETGIVESVALHVTFPSISEDEESKEEDKGVKELRELFRSAQRYSEAHRDTDLRLEALAPYAQGKKLVVFHANTVKQIKAVVKFAAELGLKAAISGGREAWKVASLLADRKVPVLISVLDLPMRRHDPYDSAYANAARLHKAGVTFAIRTSSSSDVRNLPYHAAMAAAYGLPRDVAFKAITEFPARIFGLDRGTLEPGKPADLFIATGDPLEIATDVVYVMIDGKPQSLETRHTKLYQKFLERVRKESKDN